MISGLGISLPPYEPQHQDCDAEDRAGMLEKFVIRKRPENRNVDHFTQQSPVMVEPAGSMSKGIPQQMGECAHEDRDHDEEKASEAPKLKFVEVIGQSALDGVWQEHAGRT